MQRYQQLSQNFKQFNQVVVVERGALISATSSATGAIMGIGMAAITVASTPVIIPVVITGIISAFVSTAVSHTYDDPKMDDIFNKFNHLAVKSFNSYSSLLNKEEKIEKETGYKSDLRRMGGISDVAFKR